jgi:formate dehydrogenase subunit gamma
MTENRSTAPDSVVLSKTAEICLGHGNQPDALLEILHDLQHALGHIPERALPAIAKALNLSRAEVHGVVTFYHDFRRQPAGRHVVKVCRAEACQAMGANALVASIEKTLKIKLGETTADGSVTLEAVYCLGNCALSPAMLVDEKLVGRVDGAKFARMAAGLQA